MTTEILQPSRGAGSVWRTTSVDQRGVGLATGRAVRASLIVVVSVTLLVSLAIYGTSGNFNLSG